MSTQRPGLATTGLDTVRSAPTMLQAIRAVSRAVAESTRLTDPASAGAALSDVRTALEDPADGLTAIAAVHVLAAVPGRPAEQLLADTMEAGDPAFRAHAAWAVGRRPRSDRLLVPLVELVADGGLAGMHAQATLLRWHAHDSGSLAEQLGARLSGSDGVEARRSLVETMGQLEGPAPARLLSRVAGDREEASTVRAAAMAALGARSLEPLPSTISALAASDDCLAPVARLAVLDRQPIRLAESPSDGLRVAQVHLGAEVDPDLQRTGIGDTGGVATLLVKLAAALAQEDAIDHVMTIGRGASTSARDVNAAGHADGTAAGLDATTFVPALLDPDAGMSFSHSWPARLSAERSIRRILARRPPPHVVHLRIADVGTLAAADVCRKLGLPIVFSLAPDPHALLHRREQAGDLDRRSFAAEDGRLALWYRVALVERLVKQAAQLVLFPRHDLRDELRELIGIDPEGERARLAIVPEGIDSGQIRSAVSRRHWHLSRADAGEPDQARAVTDLRHELRCLPAARHGLPLVLSIGRLNEVKGMARLVATFAADERLRSRATLVIVGGDLAAPNATEAAELARIAALREAQPALEDSLVMLGHRPHAEVAELLALTRLGDGQLVGDGGVYASASRKEEFGLALVEALAAGLPVVAPLIGGPATYVEDGLTGCLVDTTDPAALAGGVHRALDMAPRAGRAEHAAGLIRRRYDIAVMANRLAGVYSRLPSVRTERLAS